MASQPQLPQQPRPANMNGSVTTLQPIIIEQKAEPPKKVDTVTATLLDPAAMHEFLMVSGVKKAHMSLPKMALMGMMAGFYISIGGMAYVNATTGSPSPGMVFYASLIFATALSSIILVGGELFTGNCMIIVAVLSNRIKLWEYFADIAVVYFSNFFGCIFFAVIHFGTGAATYSAKPGNPLAANICKIADKKGYERPHEMFFRGVMANFCVCLAVLCANTSRSTVGKYLGAHIPVAVFILSGYDHSIANMYYFSFATLLNCPTPHGRYWLNLLLCTVGNILGAILISAPYWFVSIHGTKLELAHVPNYAADGFTIIKCPKCGEDACMCDERADLVKEVLAASLRDGVAVNVAPNGAVTVLNQTPAQQQQTAARIAFAASLTNYTGNSNATGGAAAHHEPAGFESIPQKAEGAQQA